MLGLVCLFVVGGGFFCLVVDLLVIFFRCFGIVLSLRVRLMAVLL